MRYITEKRLGAFITFCNALHDRLIVLRIEFATSCAQMVFLAGLDGIITGNVPSELI